MVVNEDGKGQGAPKSGHQLTPEQPFGRSDETLPTNNNDNSKSLTEPAASHLSTQMNSTEQSNAKNITSHDDSQKKPGSPKPSSGSSANDQGSQSPKVQSSSAKPSSSTVEKRPEISQRITRSSLAKPQESVLATHTYPRRSGLPSGQGHKLPPAGVQSTTILMSSGTNNSPQVSQGAAPITSAADSAPASRKPANVRDRCRGIIRPIHAAFTDCSGLDEFSGSPEWFIKDKMHIARFRAGLRRTESRFVDIGELDQETEQEKASRRSKMYLYGRKHTLPAPSHGVDYMKSHLTAQQLAKEEARLPAQHLVDM